MTIARSLMRFIEPDFWCLSSPEPEGEADMRTPHQGKLIEAMRRVDPIGAPRRCQEDTLLRQPDVKLCTEFHGLRRAALESAPAVRTMAGQALLEHFDQKLNVRETNQAGKLVLQASRSRPP